MTPPDGQKPVECGGGRIPLVNYLALEPEPHLIKQVCGGCGATYLDRRSQCASCFGTDFVEAAVATSGTIRSFTIVTQAAPGIAVPFVAAIVECGDTFVAGNVVGIPADPDHVATGMKVVLDTVSWGQDAEGTEAVGFAFTPAGAPPE